MSIGIKCFHGQIFFIYFTWNNNITRSQHIKYPMIYTKYGILQYKYPVDLPKYHMVAEDKI